MAGNGARFTPTEQRIFNVLADGKRHSMAKLYDCLSDDLAEMAAVRVHVCNLRKKLGLSGKGVACELIARKTYYCLIELESHSCNEV